MKFFPTRPNISPKIYAYTEPHPEYKGLMKIGYTTRALEIRMGEHLCRQCPNNKINRRSIATWYYNQDEKKT